MLTVETRTAGRPLVIANMLTTAGGDAVVPVHCKHGDGFITGRTADGVSFAFSTAPGRIWTVDGISTDALALTWDGDTVFAAMVRPDRTGRRRASLG